MKTITLPITGSKEDLYNKFSKFVESSGGQFVGSVTDGMFDVNHVSGTYVVTENAIHITIDKKPFFISMKLLEKELSKHI